MTRDARQKCLIYCRVSDAKQMTRGDGLGSQETRCREYAAYRQLDVIEVLREDYTGATADRPAMGAALALMRKHRRNPLVIIIDDLSRLARDVVSFRKLRDEITAAGGLLESPSIVFREDSDSLFMENVLASAAQHQRQKNAEQTKNRMKARAMNGYWVFQAPLGYRFDKASGGGKHLIRHEPLASIIQEALEGYASGRFGSQAEVKRFLEANPLFPKDRHGLVTNERVHQILMQPLYAGCLEVPRWKLPLRKAQHDGLISLETFDLIQDRLAGKPRAPSRKDINADFPMRGFIACGDCRRPMTAAWSKGHGGAYPYYICRQPGCASSGKSVARAKVEDALRAFVRSLTPARELVELANAMFRDLWDHRARQVKERRAALKLEPAAVEKKIDQFLNRIVDTDSPTVISAYELKIGELEREKLSLTEHIAKCGTPARGYDEVFQTAMAFLANPWNLWETGRLEDRRAMLKLVFPGHLVYARKTGLQTPEISMPFKALESFLSPKRGMARSEGVHLPTIFNDLVWRTAVKWRTGLRHIPCLLANLFSAPTHCGEAA